MKDIILFDLDGTLTNPKEGITKCVDYALSHFGIKTENLDDLCKFIGPPLVDSFMEYYGFDKKKALEALRIYRERFDDVGLFENQLLDGIEEMLKVLRHSNKKLYVATSKPEIASERIIEHFGLSQYFEKVCGSTLDNSRVKKTDIISYALECAGNPNKERVIMVGDRLHDVIGAKNNNIKCIGVLFGFGSHEELSEAGADYIVSDVDSLTQLLLI